ncbi:MAG: hypothetical protein IAG13_02310 [Deltaproteobacteria bacterium]|nr:hypothetical protein [Nannocystaceae bacterium]
MARHPGITMTKPLSVACMLVSLGCGARTVDEDDTEGASDGSDTQASSDSTVGSATVVTTAPDTDPSTDPTSTDPATGESIGESSTAGGSGGDGTGCCEVHDAAGCEEDAVAQCVCEIAPDCCVFEWGKNCVDAAMNACAATCMASDESGSESGGPSETCDEPVVIELGADDAVLSGGWELVMSMLGEGMIAGIQTEPDADNAVHWDIDVPCDGEFFIWVRARDEGNGDSFFATLDGEPDPAPIFEADCTMGGQGYVWTRLNWRDPEAMACEYVEDPWLASWTTGTHAFELSYRDSIAVARIVVTNDDAYVPD